MRWAVLALGMASALRFAIAGTGTDESAEKPRPRAFDPWRIEDMERLASVLRTHVATIEATTPTKEPLAEPVREGYGAVIGPRRVAALSFLVEGATRIRVGGPGGHLAATIVRYDIERRVALLETRVPLRRVGLHPAPTALRSDRALGQSVYALVSALEHSGVVHGVLTTTGEEEEYEGHPRIDLRLILGMPVFDDRARLIGYARAVAWDFDRFMLVPSEMILGVNDGDRVDADVNPAPRPAPTDGGEWPKDPRPTKARAEDG